ncbi:T9SS type A sorting domain-containing protein [Hyunsoonleella sp. 2307UL5-6]|uniref:T9SS type A sorting domain-containing protein n=1 Tax=Hyunsoonleella sp. 2307UL5-6 TaxID=3384768 RepID=UPI0039BC8851
MKTFNINKSNISLYIIAVIFLVTFNSYSQRYCSNVQASPSNAANLNDNQNTTFEVFKSTSGGVGCLTATSAGNNELKIINGEINGNVGNVLLRESKRRNPQINDRLSYTISFSENNKSSANNVYHGAYGWWRNGNSNNNSFIGGARNGVVEWYVVQGHNDIEHPTFGMDKVQGFSYEDAGGTYDVYIKDIVNQGSVYNNVVNFTQIKCVRRSSVAKTSTRTLNMQVHFDNMLSATRVSRIDNLFEISYCVEAFGAFSGSNINVKFDLDARFSSSGGSNNGGNNSGSTNWPEISPGKYTWSSGDWPGYQNSRANDNNLNTRWASQANTVNPYMAYDLQGHYDIGKIKLHFDQAYAYNVRIWVNNGGGWYIAKDAKIDYYTQEISVNRTARWISVQSLGNPYNHISLKEFDVFGFYKYGKQEKLKGEAKPLPKLDKDELTLTKELSIFPNPVSDVFNIRLKGMGETDVVISDLLGKTIYKITTDNENLELRKGSAFKSGMYLVTATDKFDNRYTSKLIIK